MYMIKNYIFDFDGTLMDTAPVILATMRATFEELGLPERTEEECRATIGLRLEEIPKALFPERSDIGSIYAETYRRLFPLYNKPGVARPFPNVIETIKKLHADGHGLAIASSRSHKSLEEFVQGMGLEEAFQILIAGDDVQHGKPSPEPVLTILEKMNWKAEETLVIGDAAVDILMGKAASCQTCAVTYGNGTLTELESAAPDFLIDNLTELLKIQ